MFEPNGPARLRAPQAKSPALVPTCPTRPTCPPALLGPPDPLGSVMVGFVGFDVFSAREQLDEHDAGHKAADMSPEGHPAPCVFGGVIGEPAEDLNRHPINQHDPRGEGN